MRVRDGKAGHALSRLRYGTALPPDVPDWAVLTGADPALPSSFAVGTAAQVAVRRPALLCATPARWDRPFVPLGTDRPNRADA